MNEFVNRLSSNGVLGLLFYLLPFGYISIKLLVSFVGDIRRKDNEHASLTGTLFCSLISCLISGASGSLTIQYAVWIMLAYAYAEYSYLKLESKHV